jgi:6-phosphogluconolactonase
VKRLSLILAFLAASLQLPAADPSGEYILFAGTYTRGDSKGIYAYKFNAATGEIGPLGLAAETPNPSFLTIHPNGRYLYSVSEISDFNGEKTGAVSAFSIDKATGKLTHINTVPSKGTSPCYVSVDKSGRNLLAVNYGTGSTSLFPIESSGRLKEASAFIQHTGSSVNPARQKGPHAHSVVLSPDNRFAMVADLGLDKLLIYRLDASKGTLTPNDPPFLKLKPGAGPRHFTFHPNGRYGYVINEIASTVTAASYDKSKGAFSEIQTITTLPKDFSGQNSTAEVLVHPSGKFLYGSNRGHDSIAVFSIGGDGKLTALDHTSTQGKTPRNFRIDPTGHYLFAANQATNNIVVFRIDQNTGKLTPTGKSIDTGMPVCLKFLPLR